MCLIKKNIEEWKMKKPSTWNFQNWIQARSSIPSLIIWTIINYHHHHLLYEYRWRILMEIVMWLLKMWHHFSSFSFYDHDSRHCRTRRIVWPTKTSWNQLSSTMSIHYLEMEKHKQLHKIDLQLSTKVDRKLKQQQLQLWVLWNSGRRLKVTSQHKIE